MGNGYGAFAGPVPHVVEAQGFLNHIVNVLTAVTEASPAASSALTAMLNRVLPAGKRE